MSASQQQDALVANRRVTILLRAVGGQMLLFVVRQLINRLLPVAESIYVEEVHGMAQRGGSVTALLDVDFKAGHEPRASRVLIGLERIEGARGLPQLRTGDVAFIAVGTMLPPGQSFDPKNTAPTNQDLERLASDVGIRLHLVETPLASPWAVVQAAFDQGTLPSPPPKQA